MRSMVDTEGPVEIASNRGDRGEDRKVDLIMQERSYNVKVTALQETKWFGSEVYLEGEGGSNCAHRLGNRCLEGNREAMEGMALQSSLSMSTVGWEI